jgi:gas vesicle protein
MSEFESVKDYEFPEQEDEVRNQSTVRSIAIFVAGASIGAGVALLLAPATGEDIRYALRRGYRRTLKGIGRRTQDFRDRAEDLLEHAQDLREHAGDIRERGAKLLRFAGRR